MGILINNETRVVVQGITGTQGSFHTRLMKDYGTNIVAGVTPGKGGLSVHGVPVYDTVEEAQKEQPLDASIIFVPAQFAAEAALEAIDNEIKTIVIITEHIPIKDSIEIISYARKKETSIIGPNTPGILATGQCKLGIMPTHVFMSGNIGITSRSGTLTYEIAANLTKNQIGQSTCIGLGGDPITGLNFIDALKLFEKDPETKLVVLIGEIGGNLEELTAEYIAGGYPKPVIAYVAGRTAIPGKRMGHAGALIMGKSGTAESKIRAFTNAGVTVAQKPSDIGCFVKNFYSKLMIS
jgi:succinyl-CoA synthetase alpha subunit